MEDNKKEAFFKKLEKIKTFLPIESDFWELSIENKKKYYVNVKFYNTTMYTPTTFYKPISKMIILEKK